MNKDIKILIVDDCSTVRMVLKKMLHNLGYHNVDEADDGLVALPMLQADRFDLLVSDWSMPRMDGIALVRAVRDDRRIAHIPCLMVTAETRPEHLLKALAAGVSDFMTKPFNVTSLGEKLNGIFGLQRMAS